MLLSRRGHRTFEEQVGGDGSRQADRLGHGRVARGRSKVDERRANAAQRLLASGRWVHHELVEQDDHVALAGLVLETLLQLRAQRVHHRRPRSKRRALEQSKK